MKSINTLIPDIYAVVEGKGGWGKTSTDFFLKAMRARVQEQFVDPRIVRDWVGLSAMGKPCDREKWYIANHSELAEELDAGALGTFFYGHMLEQLVIALAIAAGHAVDGIQEKLDVFGIPGSGDCIIDGWVIDVKSAAPYLYPKFQWNRLKGYHKKTKEGKKWIPAHEVDGFGYISQLSSYLHGYKDDPRVVNKESAAFLAVNKGRFALTLDTYNLKKELEQKEAEATHCKAVVAGPKPRRRFTAEEDGKSGNMKLCTGCIYCDFKKPCWPGLRRFAYSGGPRYLTTVVKEPDVKEIKL